MISIVKYLGTVLGESQSWERHTPSPDAYNSKIGKRNNYISNSKPGNLYRAPLSIRNVPNMDKNTQTLIPGTINYYKKSK